MVKRTLFLLAEIHLTLGLIDLTEFEERLKVAGWLASEGSEVPDPREPKLPDAFEISAETTSVKSESTARDGPSSGFDAPDWLELVVLKKWYFTRSDPDPYPSTPHGHLQSASRAWPKLNPYTGRAFKAKYQEDRARRLSKSEMQVIWADQAFRDFCRSHIVWYMEEHPHHKFGVRHPLRFPWW